MEDLSEVNLGSTIVGKDPTGRPIYIWGPGQTLLEAYQDAVFGGPGWRESIFPRVDYVAVERWCGENGYHLVDDVDEFAKIWADANGKVIVPANNLVISPMVQKDYAFFERDTGEQEDLDAAFEEKQLQLAGIQRQRSIFAAFIKQKTEFFKTYGDVTLGELVVMYNNYGPTGPGMAGLPWELSRERIGEFAMEYWESQGTSAKNGEDLEFSGFHG